VPSGEFYPGEAPVHEGRAERSDEREDGGDAIDLGDADFVESSIVNVFVQTFGGL
jgi:hypothetical protein